MIDFQTAVLFLILILHGLLSLPWGSEVLESAFKETRYPTLVVLAMSNKKLLCVVENTTWH